MSLSRDSRQERKLKAIRLAQFRLKQRLEAIDWTEDVLLPEVEALKAGRPVLGLTEGMAFDIEVVNEDSDSSKARHDNYGGNADRQPSNRQRSRKAAARARLRHRK